MAVRLQLKLGAVTDQDRLPDSPDTVVVVEPNVGSVGRTKGNLYLLVTSTVPGPRAREATRLVAETIRNEYYYDESAGIRQCLIKVLGIANKRLTHQRDKFGLGADGTGPIGVAMAVVRGREMYVATVGPAEAYLIRQARLSTLPDPNGERGLPATELVPEVWRGELNVGDSLCLVSANVMARVGADALKDAMVTLHPQSAVEHLHARFVAADGRGSDGAVAFEATEVGATFKQKTLVPVRPAEPLAGAPDKSPIPLADSVAAGAAAITDVSSRARGAAGSRIDRVVWAIQDHLPKRTGRQTKASTASSRAETQRRAAVALLFFLAVASVLAGALWVVGGSRGQPGQAIKSASVAQQAFNDARADVDKLSSAGVDLIKEDRNRALQLLQDAYQQLARAEQAGYPASEIAALRATVMSGLDRIYGAVKVASTDLFTFPASAGQVKLAGIVRGADGAPYVLDTGTKTVWRIDLVKKAASPVLRSGQKTTYGKVADPKLITISGPDVLILDSKNALWRWRPLGTAGRGTLFKINVTGSSTWGTDVRVMSTFVVDYSAAFYKLYVVDPSQQNVMVFSPNNDGSGYSSTAVPRLAANRAVDGMTALVLDGDIYATENGALERLSPATGWKPGALPDTDIRPTSTYTILDAPNNADGSYSKGTGILYVFDTTNHRVVAYAKADGHYVAQYQVAADAKAWTDLQGMLVVPPASTDATPDLWWISSTGMHVALLAAVPEGSAASPSPSPSATASPKPGKSQKPGTTPRPGTNPRPTTSPGH